MIIRKASNADFLQVQALAIELGRMAVPYDKFFDVGWYISQYGIDYLTSRIQEEKESVCFVAEENEELIVYLTGIVSEEQTWRPGKRTEVENVFIDEKHRGKQVGSALLKAFFIWSKEKKAKRCFVLSYAEDKKAIRFYKKKNFSPNSLILEQEL